MTPGLNRREAPPETAPTLLGFEYTLLKEMLGDILTPSCPCLVPSLSWARATVTLNPTPTKSMIPFMYFIIPLFQVPI